MKRIYRLLALLLALCLTAGLLAGCDEDPNDEEKLSVVMTGLFNTMDPALAATAAERTVVLHLFDNLLRWDGEKTVSAVAQSWQETDNEDGTVTYTFHLRGDAVWSDGSSLTAEDFVYAWKRLVSPDTASPSADILSMVSGYDEARAGDSEALQVSAPEKHTFEVTLSGPCAYFLSGVCTAPATMPVQQAAVESDEHWADSRTYFVGNGPFRRGGDWTDHHRLTLQKQDNHYDAKRIVPDRVELVLQTEEQAHINAGRVDVVIGAANEPTGNGGDPTVGVLLINQMATNMERDGLRQAMSLAIDRAAVVKAMADGDLIPAEGLVPHGIRTAEGGDFRQVNGAVIDNDPDTYQQRCQQAVTLLREAGFTRPEVIASLGTVTLLHRSTPAQTTLARQLQQVWRDTLGIDVTLQSADEEEFDQLLHGGEFTLALTEITALYNDAAAYLDMWRSGSSCNYAQIGMNAYDILMRVAAASTSDEARDAYLKDAEGLLLDGANVVPLYGRQQPYQMAENVIGAVSDGLGAWYFGATRRLAK